MAYRYKVKKICGGHESYMRGARGERAGPCGAQQGTLLLRNMVIEKSQFVYPENYLILHIRPMRYVKSDIRYGGPAPGLVVLREQI